jgi:DNA-binding transcriptional MerR regulator
VRIGQLARRAGLTVDAIRYYEKKGLLRTPPHTLAGHRDFPRTRWRS